MITVQVYGLILLHRHIIGYYLVTEATFVAMQFKGGGGGG